MNGAKEWEAVFSQITKAASLKELGDIHRSFFSFPRIALPNNHTDIQQVYLFLSRIHDAIIQKALHYAEQTVIKEGCGSPPEVYSWIITGSGGRKEQTAWTDQDNGIIYRCSSSQNLQNTEAFIKRFAELGVQYLQQVGYPLCPGNVMATNTRWCKSETEWKFMIKSWGENPWTNDVRFLLIASDFRVLYGSEGLGEALRCFFSSFVQKSPFLLFRLAEHAVAHPVPVNILRQIITERWGEHSGMFDLKHGIYVPLVNSVRFWALAYGIEDTSTFERIKRLEEKGLWTPSEGKTISSAFSHIARLRLYHHLTQKKQKDLLNHHINLSQLKKQDIVDLKKAMRAAKEIQSKIKHGFLYKNKHIAKRISK